MLTLCFSCTDELVAEPIKSITGALLGVEVLTRFNADCFTDTVSGVMSARSIRGREAKRPLLFYLLNKIEAKSDFFLSEGLVCAINIDFDMAGLLVMEPELSDRLNKLPFIRFQVSERFPNLSHASNNPLLKEFGERYHLWLADLGAGGTNLEAVQSGLFKCVKVDKYFYQSYRNSLLLPVMINRVHRYCDQIIVTGVEDLSQLGNIERGITGIQGDVYKSVPFCGVETLT